MNEIPMRIYRFRLIQQFLVVAFDGFGHLSVCWIHILPSSEQQAASILNDIHNKSATRGCNFGTIIKVPADTFGDRTLGSAIRDHHCT